MTLNKIKKMIHSKVSPAIECTEFRNSVLLEGEVDSWHQVITAGKIAAKSPYKGVINRIYVKGLTPKPMKKPEIKDTVLDGKNVDVLIIGGGVIGCAIARYLSKWDLSILLVDKEDDLAMHQSSRNDGMVHPGVNPKPGSLKAKFNVRGNALYENLAKELNVPFRRTGSFVLFDSQLVFLASSLLMNRAKKNSVKAYKLKRKEILKYEPNIADSVVGGIHLPSAGICPPYKMTVALAENAVNNGVQISLNTAVTSMEIRGKMVYSVETNRGTVFPKAVINAAGLYSDKIADMADDQFFTIHPRKGEVALLDKSKGDRLNSIVAIVNAKLARSDTKGGGLVRTYEGNILVGPNAYEQPYKEDYSTDIEGIHGVLDKNLPYINGIDKSDVITYLAGTRAATYKEDFIIEPSEQVSNLIHAAGIQSPGYASAPAIAEEIERMTVAMLKDSMEVEKKEHWDPTREGIPLLSEMTVEERNRFIKGRKEYGQIICRCEEVSKGEIIDAIRSPIPALSIDAIKRRTRAGMGRCQGGFCLPLVAKIIEEEVGMTMSEITKKGGASQILFSETKKTV